VENAEECELLETVEIRRASANSEVGESFSKDGSPAQVIYDQTRLDSVSQLYGLPPDELSEIPSYIEPQLEEKSFDTIAQLWDMGLSREKSARAPPDDYLGDDEREFSSIAELWGTEFEDLRASSDNSEPTSSLEDKLLSSSATRSVSSSELEELLSTSATRGVGSSGGKRLSQILADEVWDEEIEKEEEMNEPFTFEDYEKQVQELLNAEKEELIETAAILNARPGADGIEAPEQENEPEAFLNATTVDDDLSVLEMDTPFEIDMTEEKKPLELEPSPELIET